MNFFLHKMLRRAGGGGGQYQGGAGSREVRPRWKGMHDGPASLAALHREPLGSTGDDRVGRELFSNLNNIRRITTDSVVSTGLCGAEEQ